MSFTAFALQVLGSERLHQKVRVLQPTIHRARQIRCSNTGTEGDSCYVAMQRTGTAFASLYPVA